MAISENEGLGGSLKGIGNREKTSFITPPRGTFFYKFMQFCLKNATVTYQIVMAALFYDMIHHE